LRILYIAPENVTGGFALFVEGHKKRGNACRWITFFPNEFGFDEDICFNLWGMPTRIWVKKLRRSLNRMLDKPELPELSGDPPFWKPTSSMEDVFYRIRDLVNSSRIEKVISLNSLNNYDIYHFEQGIDPFRDGRWVKSLSLKGKAIVAFYHGTDLRNRGVIPAVHAAAKLNLTSEIDLLDRLPGMKYLYLPIDIARLPVRTRPLDVKPLRICHAARNRKLKGSDFIEQAVMELKSQFDIGWVMIESMAHSQALAMKAECDIYIDQITDRGGWGYGASSVESLAMGIPTLTMINPQVAAFLGEHPFVHVTPQTLKAELERLIQSPDLRCEISEQSKSWAVARHGIDSVMDTLYGYYNEAGIA
jgi:hypothetical protein